MSVSVTHWEMAYRLPLWTLCNLGTSSPGAELFPSHARLFLPVPGPRDGFRSRSTLWPLKRVGIWAVLEKAPVPAWHTSRDTGRWPARSQDRGLLLGEADLVALGIEKEL